MGRQTEDWDGGLPFPQPASARDITTALSHYYRGELSRMISWRDRIDVTTNWALGATAGMLSLGLSTPTASHAVLLFAMLLVFLILVIEARRYRFFHVYRGRVRLLERHYYAPLFGGRDAEPDADWLAQLGADLLRPRFTMPLVTALSRRLRRNYSWIFLILLLSWLMKTSGLLRIDIVGAPLPPITDPVSGAAIGSMPGWAVCLVVAAFYAVLGYLIVSHREAPGELAYGEVHM